MGDSLYFYIFVSFFFIFVFCTYLARVGGGWFFVFLHFCIILLYFCIFQLLSQGGAVGDGQKGDSKVFCRLSRENLIQSRLYCFFYDQLLALVPPWLNIVHKYTCDIFDQSLSILGRQKEFNTRDTITSERFRQRIGISKLFALNTCCTMHIQVC